MMTRSKRFVENEEEKSVGHKKKAVEEKGIDGRKNNVRGENKQEKEKQIMVNKKELNDREKEKEVEKEKENKKN